MRSRLKAKRSTPTQLARLIEACTDQEIETLDAIAERAGLIWTCNAERADTYPCGWRNIETARKCGQCGTARPKPAPVTP